MHPCHSAFGMLILSFGATTTSAQVTQRLSVDSHGMQGDNFSGSPSISADGRFVAFVSHADNLVPGGTTQTYHIFVHDRNTGAVELVSVSSQGVQANGPSYLPCLSGDGRFVAFMSLADNLVPNDINHGYDVFVRDRQTGTTAIVSVDSNGLQQQFGDSGAPAITPDGRYVAFQSSAFLAPQGWGNSAVDSIYVHDRLTGTTETASVNSDGLGATGPDGPVLPSSIHPSISADGRFVAFVSYAINLVPSDTNGAWDGFVHDRQIGTTERISVDSNGNQANNDSSLTTISADGRFVAFESAADNLVAGDSNHFADVFVHDRLTGVTELASISSSGAQADSSCNYPCISADGRYVAFYSSADTLVPGDTNGVRDVFVHDRQMGPTESVSVNPHGIQGDADSTSTSNSLSSDGRFVVFDSQADQLVPGDTNFVSDAFLHDRVATGFASICDPAVGGVTVCPCSNPPSAFGHGCDNSSATGGAILAASGIAYVSMDSLQFTTSAEKPTATSIVMQGNALAANGIVFGQGVRCVAGTLKRLYTKTASGGSITAPQAGDPSVSTRSAALGDVISAGQSRWYLVYYRDPNVLGGCPASSTFNATQTARIDWSL